jgi:hypothetical protein
MNSETLTESIMRLTWWLMLLPVLVNAVPTGAADSLETRLAAVEDRLAIEQLLTGDYPRALDYRRWPEYAALFTSDGELSFRDQVLKGPAAIEKYFTNSPVRPGSPPPRAGEVRTLHVVTNLSFKIDGDTAVGGAYWETIGVADGRTTVLSAGHYEDVLRKEQGRWKFLKRVIASDLAPPR